MYLYFILLVSIIFKMYSIKKEAFNIKKCKKLYIDEPPLSDPYNDSDYKETYNQYKDKLKKYSENLIKYCLIK